MGTSERVPSAGQDTGPGQGRTLARPTVFLFFAISCAIGVLSLYQYLHGKLDGGLETYFSLLPPVPFSRPAAVWHNFLLVFQGYSEGFLRTIIGYVLFAAMALFFLGCGKWVLDLWVRTDGRAGALELNRKEEWALRYLLGSLIGSLSWLALGSLRILNPVAAFGLLFLGLFLGARHLRGKNAGPAIPAATSELVGNAMSRTEKVLAASLVLLLAVLSTFSVPFQTHVDVVMGQMALPNYYIYAGSVSPYPYHQFSYIPQNFEMLLMWSLLLGSEVCAGLVLWGFLAAFVLLMLGFLERRADRWSSLLAALLFVSAPLVVHQSVKLKNDLSPAAFLFAHYCALAEALDRRGASEGAARRWVILAGVLCGGAVGHKLHGLIAAGVSTLVIIGNDFYWKRKAAIFRPLVFPWIAGLSALCLPWLIRDFWATGNPVYPFLNDLFGTHPVKPWHGLWFQGVREGTNRTWRYFSALAYSEKELMWGPSILFAFMALAWVRSKESGGAKSAFLAAALSWGAFFPMAFEPRYHIGYLSFLVCVPFALSLSKISPGSGLGKWRPFGSILILLYAAYILHAGYVWKIVKSSCARISSGFSPGNFPHQNGMEDWYWMCHWVNTRTDPEDAVLCFETASAYGLKRKTFFNFGHDKQLLCELAETTPDAAQLRDRLQALGIRHVLVGKDYAKSSWPFPVRGAVREKIDDLLKNHMILRFRTGDGNTSWYSFKARTYPLLFPDSRDALEFPLPCLRQAGMLYLSDRPGPARKILEDAREVPMAGRNKIRLYALLAEVYRNAGLADQAEAWAQRAISSFPGDPEAYLGLGSFYAGAGDYQKALAGYLQAFALEPGSLEICNHVGNASLMRGNLLEALRFYEKALAVNAYSIKVFNNSACALFLLGKREAALDFWQRAENTNSDSSLLNNNLGVARWAEGRAQEAVGFFDRALRLDPQDAVVAANRRLALDRKPDGPARLWVEPRLPRDQEVVELALSPRP